MVEAFVSHFVGELEKNSILMPLPDIGRALTLPQGGRRIAALLPQLHDTELPCITPSTSRPSWRSMTDRHGTRVNSSAFSTMANLPLRLAEPFRWR